jgi:uncharacterized membrane protein
MLLRQSLAALLAVLAASYTADARTPAAQPLPRSLANAGAVEELYVVGTEPFWSGRVRAGRMVFTTPDNEKGEVVRVSRHSGRRAVVFRGRMAAGAFTMTVWRGQCSDGMSDRTYPFEVTIKFTGNTLQGCGWTTRRPFVEDTDS